MAAVTDCETIVDIAFMISTIEGGSEADAERAGARGEGGAMTEGL